MTGEMKIVAMIKKEAQCILKHHKLLYILSNKTELKIVVDIVQKEAHFTLKHH